MVCLAECALRSNFVTNHGSTTRSLKHCGHVAPRCVSLTLKNWRRQGLSPLITDTCGYAARITCRATSKDGLGSCGNRRQTGSKSSFISNTKKQALDPGLRRK